MARNSNPVFKSATFQEQLKAGRAANAFETPSTGSLEDMYATQVPQGRTMTLQDVLNKVLIMGVVVLAAALAGWFGVASLAQSSTMSTLYAAAIGASIAAGIIGIVNQFKRTASPVLSVLYSALQGFALGVVSAVMDLVYPGIVLQALLGTAAVFTVTMIGYRSGKFRTSPKSRRIMTIVGFSFVGFMLLNFILGFFGSGLNTWTGWVGIGLGLVGIALGAFYLVTDFEDIQTAVAGGAPANFAWRCAFGLVLSIVWIFIEMLRLIASIRSLAE